MTLTTIQKIAVAVTAYLLAMMAGSEAVGGWWPSYHGGCNTCGVSGGCNTCGVYGGCDSCGGCERKHCGLFSSGRCGSHGCGDSGCGCRKSGCGLFSWFRRHCNRSHDCGCSGCCGMEFGAGTATVPMMHGDAFGPQWNRPAVPATVKRPPLEPLTPPPGTLGRTYKQLSTPVPEEEHPRTGMLEICNVPDGYTVKIRGMDGFRGTNGVWYFKTVRPLIPCVPFVYTAHVHGPNCHHGHCGPKTSCDYRVFRLIPGRIVYLNY